MARSSFWSFLSGYESDKNYGIKSSGRKRFFSRSYSGSVTGGGGTVLKRSVSIGNRLTGAFSYTQSKAYGAGLLGYGATTFLAYFLIYYFGIPVENGSYSAVLGALAVILAVPLLVSKRTIADALQANRVTDFIFFEFFCIKRPHTSEKTRAIPTAAVAVFGTALGLLGFFVPSWTVAVAIGGGVILFVALLSPECTFLISLMALPYLNVIPYSDIVFAAVTVLTLISFIRKVICGKRVIFFEQYDFLILLLTLIFIGVGIFTDGTESFFRSLSLLVMSFGYVLSGNLITNRRIADCAMNALVISSVPASVYSVFLFISGLSRGGITLGTLSIYSTFSGSLECAIFFLCSALFAAALSKQAGGKLGAVYSSVATLNVFVLMLTGEIMAVLALAVAAIGYFVLKMGRLSLPFLLMLALVPYLYFALPPQLTDLAAANISGAEPAAELLSVWRAALEIFSKHPIVGVGLGAEGIASKLSASGVLGYESAHNTFIELGLEAGLLALFVFVLILFVRVRHRASYRLYLKQTDLVETLSFIEAALLGMVCFGATEYIFAEGATFYLFWVVFGIGSAVLRFAKKEVDDRTLYYEDTRDDDYSAIDIHLR